MVQIYDLNSYYSRLFWFDIPFGFCHNVTVEAKTPKEFFMACYGSDQGTFIFEFDETETVVPICRRGDIRTRLATICCSTLVFVDMNEDWLCSWSFLQENAGIIHHFRLPLEMFSGFIKPATLECDQEGIIKITVLDHVIYGREYVKEFKIKSLKRVLSRGF